MYRIRLIALALVAAAPLAAQRPMPMDSGRHHMRGDGHGAMGEMGHKAHPMGRGMAFAPAQLLRHKSVLELTDAQVTRLTALRDAAQTAQEAAMKDARQHHDQLAEVMKAAAPDTAAARRHFMAAHAAMGQAHWARVRAAAQARAVLTEVQRARVDGWGDAMGRNRGHMRHGEGHPRRPAGGETKDDSE
jgi:Spy/CpxP family protein refolding chaperone